MQKKEVQKCCEEMPYAQLSMHWETMQRTATIDIQGLSLCLM